MRPDINKGLQNLFMINWANSCALLLNKHLIIKEGNILLASEYVLVLR